MIGAVDWDAWDEAYLREQIRDNPLVKDPERHKAERPFRLACIQLATYDGTVYNVRKVLEKIGHLCDYVLWDEAWIGYNAFHPLFEDHSPMRLEDLGAGDAGPVLDPVGAQAGRRLLAGLADPQARRAHPRPAALRRAQAVQRIVPDARVDLAVLSAVRLARRQRQDSRGQGRRDAVGPLHRARHRGAQEVPRVRAATTSAPGERDEEQWFFDPFVPDVVTIRGSQVHRGRRPTSPGKSLPTEVIKREQQCWNFHPKSAWHGYAGYADGYAMVDPNKLTLLTPGIDRKTGEYLDFGVPATVVANYLREQRVVPEKCDLNSILFLMTPAEDESKLNTLIAKLVKFKNLWDRDAPLPEVLPTRLRGAQRALRGLHAAAGSATRCTTSIARRTSRNCSGCASARRAFPNSRCRPKDAYEALVANDVDYVPLERSRAGSRRRSR